MISPNYTKLAQTVHLINNSNLPVGTLIEEIPTDIGRSYQGYKRGGILEGAEKMRKELMAALVWMFGIPIFNKIGNLICEKVLNIPMAIDYSNNKDGNKAIEDSINFLTQKLNPKNLDTSDLAKYGDKYLGQNASSLIKKVKGAKQITSILAIVLNCFLMGVALPKLNYKITQKKMDEMNRKKTALKPTSMQDFIESTKINKNKELSFKGNILGFLSSNLDKITYATENSNTFRLVVTDIPMIIGRVKTSRNKYEGLENLVMDGGSIFFYNFSAGLIQKALRKINKIPDINSKAAEVLAQSSADEIKNALQLIEQGETSVAKLFSKETSDLIYKEATYGKFGKINTFVKNKDIVSIDKSVTDTLSLIKSAIKDGIDDAKIKEITQQTISKINKANAKYLAGGLLVSIIGLAVIIPKLTFKITELLTGKNQFTGIAHYDDDVKKDKKNVKKS